MQLKRKLVKDKIDLKIITNEEGKVIDYKVIPVYENVLEDSYIKKVCFKSLIPFSLIMLFISILSLIDAKTKSLIIVITSCCFILFNIIMGEVYRIFIKEK
jgi:hypothetical protein